MQKIITLLVALTLVVACKGDKKSEKATVDETEKVQPNSTQEHKENEIEVVQLAADKEEFLSTTIAYFKNCKENSENRNDCRNSITKMISEFYMIDDFKKGNGEYVVYDSIQPIIKRSSNWVKLGEASDQKALSDAQKIANEGKATIAIDISESYGQVAMIIPGKLTNSGAWKLKVPNAAALVNYNAEKSFMGKPLSYAFKSSDNIVLYSRSR